MVFVLKVQMCVVLSSIIYKLWEKNSKKYI